VRPTNSKSGPPDGAAGPSESGVPLMLASEGQEVVLSGVRGGRNLSHRLAEMGLLPGVKFRILTKGRPGPFIILLKDSRLVLGHGMVHHIYVLPAPAGG